MTVASSTLTVVSRCSADREGVSQMTFGSRLVIAGLVLLACGGCMAHSGRASSGTVPDQSAMAASSNHPRIWLTGTIRPQLLARKSANDPSWAKLKAQADELAT